MTTQKTPVAEPQIITLQAAGVWREGVRSEIKVRDFAALVSDEPEALGGQDQGPNPMEYVLGSFIGCLTVMLQLVGSEQAVELTDLKFDLEGDIDLRGLFDTADVSPHFQAVRGVVTLETTAADEQITELIAESTRRCPAYNLFKDAGITPQLDWQVQRPA
ncbi:MAG: OsmC family protein [Thermaerobacterales bacterium]